MGTLIISQIAEVLQQRGWSAVDPGSLTATAHWAAFSRGTAELWVGQSERWVCLTVPQTARPDAQQLHDAHLRSLSMYGWKQALDHRGRLLLQCELPLEDVQRGHLPLYLMQLQDLFQTTPAPRGSAEAELIAEQEVFACMFGARHRGWFLKQRLRANQYHGFYMGRDREFNFYLAFNRTHGYFQLPLLERGSETLAQEQRADLGRYLLRQNEGTFWAKYGMDEEGEVVLMLDFPLVSFSRPYCLLLTQVLGHYAVETSYEILVLANLNNEAVLKKFLGTCAATTDSY